MDSSRTWLGSRRTFVAGAAAVSFGLIARPVRAALAATPRQSVGPFYPVEWSGDIDADLVRVTGAAARALGQVAYVAGRVTDTAGKPLSGATVEIWQCDANGYYRHPDDAGDDRRDAGFQGRGRTSTDAAGGYRFRTIRPVPYSGRTPHIHFRIAAEGRRDFITQMYVAGEPRNESDFLFTRISDPRDRERLLVKFDPADREEPGALAGRFDIVIA